MQPPFLSYDQQQTQLILSQLHQIKKGLDEFKDGAAQAHVDVIEILIEIKHALQEQATREMGSHPGGRGSPGRASKGR